MAYNKYQKIMEKNGIVHFNEDVDQHSCGRVIEKIVAYNKMPKTKRPKEITLVVTSEGGCIHSMFSLIAAMEGSDIPIKTVGLGICASAGCLILMAGTKGRRFIVKNCNLMSHQFYSFEVGKQHELEATNKSHQLLDKMIVDHYKKCTGLPEKKIRKKLLGPSDTWLSVQEAVKYGIVDKIVQNFST